MKKLITRWRQIEDNGPSCQWQADTPLGTFRVVEHRWQQDFVDGYRVIPPGADCADSRFGNNPTLNGARAAIESEVRDALGAQEANDETPFLTWSMTYNAYERLADNIEQLNAVLQPLQDAMKREGRIPEWAGPDLLRALAWSIGRAIRWSSMSAATDAAGDRQVAEIAEAINLHPTARAKDRFQCDPPLKWEQDVMGSWVAVSEASTVEFPRDSAVYRILASGPKVYELWVWFGPAEVGRWLATAMIAEYRSARGATHLASYPLLRSAKGAAEIDVVKRIHAGKLK